jgi:hypothetical protein
MLAERMLRVRVPVAEFPATEAIKPRPLPRTLDRATIGILNNQKPNATELFGAIEAELLLRVQSPTFVYRTKSPPSPAAVADIDYLVHVSDVVLVGSGD